MPASSAPRSEEPLTKGTILQSTRAAVLETWGDAGLRAVADRLPEEARAATMGAELVPLGWHPTRYILDWNDAILEGPAAGDLDAFRQNVDTAMALGFGRVRRTFLRFATPLRLAARAAELWRHEHTHGTVTILDQDIERGTARVHVCDHPFLTRMPSRVAIAEAFRYVLSRSRAKNVRETHELRAGELWIHMRWDAGG